MGALPTPQKTYVNLKYNRNGKRNRKFGNLVETTFQKSEQQGNTDKNNKKIRGIQEA